MADAPLLFGRPGEFDDATWVWESGDITVRLVQYGARAWEATVWVRGDHVHMNERPTWRKAIAEAEEELTRLAAGLDAMGVPHG